MKNNSQNPILLFLIINLFMISSCKKTAETEPDELKVYNLTEKVNGKTFNDLSIATTNFQYPYDFQKSPLNDKVGSLSGVSNQPLPDFTILASNRSGVSERSLTISSKKPVFFNIIGIVAWYYENDPCDPDKPPVGQSVKDYLLDFLTPYFLDKNVVNLTATLDGKPIVPDLKQYKFISETFKLKAPIALAGSYCPGNTNDATWINIAYSLLLKLPKGKHILAYKGDILDDSGHKENDFHSEVIWNLTVE